MHTDSKWVPVFVEEDFNQRMENAFRRVSGSIGFDLAMDRGNTKAFTAAANQAADSYANGPAFMRVGKSAMDMAGYTPNAVVDIKSCAGEVLREFFEEGKAAYHAAAAALHLDALKHMQALGMDEHHSKAVLSSADSAFALPSKDEFTAMGLEVCGGGGMAPSTKAVMAGGVAFMAIVLLLRSPVIAAIAGVAAGAAAYLAGRSRNRARTERLLHLLPRRLYDRLHGGLQTNVRRYGEIVNGALAVADSPASEVRQ